MNAVSVSRELLQSYLYAFGEEALASRVRTLNDWDMRDICAAAGQIPIRPIDKAFALAAVEFLEGARRPLKRNRPQKEVCTGC